MAGSFSRLVADLDYPMLVVTCDDGTQQSGCLVGFWSQCSIHPARVMVWISETNHTHPVALRSDHLGVHVLSAEDLALAELFGERTGDEVDKFTRCRWRAAAGAAPILEDCRRWLVGRVLGQRRDGDHTGFLLEPVEVSEVSGPDDAGSWPGQLGYQAVRHFDPGHEP